MSRVAQWKRAGPITQRSVDRNHALLIFFPRSPDIIFEIRNSILYANISEQIHDSKWFQRTAEMSVHLSRLTVVTFDTRREQKLICICWWRSVKWDSLCQLSSFFMRIWQSHRMTFYVLCYYNIRESHNSVSLSSRSEQINWMLERQIMAFMEYQNKEQDTLKKKFAKKFSRPRRDSNPRPSD